MALLRCPLEPNELSEEELLRSCLEARCFWVYVKYRVEPPDGCFLEANYVKNRPPSHFSSQDTYSQGR